MIRTFLMGGTPVPRDKTTSGSTTSSTLSTDLRARLYSAISVRTSNVGLLAIIPLQKIEKSKDIAYLTIKNISYAVT